MGNFNNKFDMPKINVLVSFHLKKLAKTHKHLKATNNTYHRHYSNILLGSNNQPIARKIRVLARAIRVIVLK